jgi:putative oxidoreductase
MLFAYTPVQLNHWQSIALLLLRVVAGFLFIFHGTQKLWGWPAGNPLPGFELRMIAAYMEIIGGPLIMFGLFTRLTAFLLSGEMAVAYWTAHFPSAFWPIVNRGEGAALYCFIFLFLAFIGPGPYSLDAWLWRRKQGSSIESVPRMNVGTPELHAGRGRS